MDGNITKSRLSLSGDRPVLACDLPGVWRVLSGAVDVFGTRLLDGKTSGRREFLVRVREGDGFAGMAEEVGPIEAGKGQLTLMMVGVLGTVIEHVHEAEYAIIVDHWVSAIDRQCRKASDVWATQFAEPGRLKLAAEARLMAPAGKLFWALDRTGALSTEDGSKIPAGAAPLAVGSAMPLLAEHDMTLQCVTSEDLLAAGTLGDAVQSYYVEALAAFSGVIAERMRTRAAFAVNSEKANRAREQDGLDELAGVGVKRTKAVTFPPGTPPSWRALAAVAAALGQDVVLPTDPVALATERGGIQGLAEVCGLRSRIVILKANWWAENNGPLIASLSADRTPVALLPDTTGGYSIWNPVTDKTQKVDSEIGNAVSPSAVMLYRRFDDNPITIGSLMSFSMRRSYLKVAYLFALGLIGGGLGMFVPWATGTLVGTVVPNSDLSQLSMLTIGLIVVALSNASVNLVRGLVMQQMEQQIDLAAQSALFDRMLRLPVSFLKTFSVGDLSDRVLGLQTIRQTITGAALGGAMTGMMSIMNIGMMLAYNMMLTLFGVVAAIIVFAVSFSLVLVQLRRERDLAAARGKSASVVLQIISGVAKLKASASVGRGFGLWAARYGKQRDLFVSVQQVSNLQSIFQSAFMPLSMVVLYYFAASRVASASGAGLSLAAFLGFSSAYGQLMSGVQGLVGAASSALRAIPTYERAKPLMTAAPERTTSGVHPGILSGAIEFSNVTFRYPGMEAPVLQNLSFRIEPGQFVAFVGPSGSGKSTVLRLMLGFDTPEAGEVLYDGKPLSALNIVAVRRQLGVVLQNGRIQPMPILDNISGGRPIKLDDAWEAARKAGFEDDIKDMPMGMHTCLTDGGTTLSGGQRQRLMIARALAGKPRILMLDEATSALDNKTQAVVTESVQKLSLTRITIAHRLSTIAGVDRVIVLDQGNVVQDGGFNELLETEGLFRELARRQLK